MENCLGINTYWYFSAQIPRSKSRYLPECFSPQNQFFHHASLNLQRPKRRAQHSSHLLGSREASFLLLPILESAHLRLFQSGWMLFGEASCRYEPRRRLWTHSFTWGPLGRALWVSPEPEDVSQPWCHPGSAVAALVLQAGPGFVQLHPRTSPSMALSGMKRVLYWNRGLNPNNRFVSHCKN